MDEQVDRHNRLTRGFLRTVGSYVPMGLGTETDIAHGYQPGSAAKELAQGERFKEQARALEAKHGPGLALQEAQHKDALARRQELLAETRNMLKAIPGPQAHPLAQGLPTDKWGNPITGFDPYIDKWGNPIPQSPPASRKPFVVGGRMMDPFGVQHKDYNKFAPFPDSEIPIDPATGGIPYRNSVMENFKELQYRPVRGLQNAVGMATPPRQAGSQQKIEEAFQIIAGALKNGVPVYGHE